MINYNSNWKKSLGFRNMQENLEMYISIGVYSNILFSKPPAVLPPLGVVRIIRTDLSEKFMRQF